MGVKSRTNRRAISRERLPNPTEFVVPERRIGDAVCFATGVSGTYSTNDRTGSNCRPSAANDATENVSGVVTLYTRGTKAGPSRTERRVAS